VKILVTAKRVPDPETVVKIAADGTSITTDNVKWVINPFDEIAIEEALRIKEKVSGTEVVLVSIGQKTAHPTVLDETADLWDTVFVSGGRRGFDL